MDPPLDRRPYRNFSQAIIDYIRLIPWLESYQHSLFTTSCRFQYDKIYKFEKLIQEKGRSLVFTFSQIRSSDSHNFLNIQPILDCNKPKFKHKQLKNRKSKFFIKIVFLLFLTN